MQTRKNQIKVKNSQAVIFPSKMNKHMQAGAQERSE
jgi:hypothetical protein